jgi:hypothetical protein
MPPQKGRPKIVEAVWRLYPCCQFGDEVTNGNRDMNSARIKVGETTAKGCKAEILGGEIGAKLSAPTGITCCLLTFYPFDAFPYPLPLSLLPNTRKFVLLSVTESCTPEKGT